MSDEAVLQHLKHLVKPDKKKIRWITNTHILTVQFKQYTLSRVVYSNSCFVKYSYLSIHRWIRVVYSISPYKTIFILHQSSSSSSFFVLLLVFFLLCNILFISYRFSSIHLFLWVAYAQITYLCIKANNLLLSRKIQQGKQRSRSKNKNTNTKQKTNRREKKRQTNTQQFDFWIALWRVRVLLLFIKLSYWTTMDHFHSVYYTIKRKLEDHWLLSLVNRK